MNVDIHIFLWLLPLLLLLFLLVQIDGSASFEECIKPAELTTEYVSIAEGVVGG